LQDRPIGVVAADVGKCGELFERAPEGNGSRAPLIARNFQLAFQ
jgi:hypothetical protein